MRQREVQSLRGSEVYGNAITLRAENTRNGESQTIVLEEDTISAPAPADGSRTREPKKGIGGGQPHPYPYPCLDGNAA